LPLTESKNEFCLAGKLIESNRKIFQISVLSKRILARGAQRATAKQQISGFTEADEYTAFTFIRYYFLKYIEKTTMNVCRLLQFQGTSAMYIRTHTKVIYVGVINDWVQRCDD